MILPSGSAAMSIDIEGKAALVVTKEDDVQIFIEDQFSKSPIIIKLGNGQQAFDELKANIDRMAVFTGD